MASTTRPHRLARRLCSGSHRRRLPARPRPLPSSTTRSRRSRPRSRSSSTATTGCAQARSHYMFWLPFCSEPDCSVSCDRRTPATRTTSASAARRAAASATPAAHRSKTAASQTQTRHLYAPLPPSRKSFVPADTDCGPQFGLTLKVLDSTSHGVQCGTSSGAAAPVVNPFGQPPAPPPYSNPFQPPPPPVQNPFGNGR